MKQFLGISYIFKSIYVRKNRLFEFFLQEKVSRTGFLQVKILFSILFSFISFRKITRIDEFNFKYTTGLGVFILGTFLFAQNPNRIFKNANLESDNSLKIKVNDGEYRLQFYTTEIVETSFIPSGESENKNSHAVILQPKSIKVKFKESKNSIQYSTKDFKVQIQKSPFKISYIHNDKEIISEKLGYEKTDSLEKVHFNLTKDEVLYGTGARVLGMNRRGNRLQLYNRAHYGYETHSELMNFTMPIVLSSKQYLIHFDNAPIGFLDLDSNQNNTLSYETISGRKTYQIVVGNSWYDLINHYTDLTGKQPLPPRWAFGNFSSRFGYHTQKEVEETVQKFRDEKIPLDAIIIDIFWFGKDIQGHMGNLKFDLDSFPQPKKMISKLKSQNVNTVLITEPFVLTTSKRWNEAVQKDVLAKDSLGNPFKYDFYFGNTGLIDIYNKNGNDWFWNIYQDLVKDGVTGMWGDLGEPEVHPKELLHATGTADEVHNIYGHDWAKLIYDGYEKEFPNVRPFILMRAGYSGSQRYGMIPWSGDVNRTWGGLKPQTEIALQMGMQGMGYMHSDLGGFAGANLNDELYRRWLQYGVFQPIYRPHAQEEVPSEPIFREPKTKANAKKSIELRYQLLPYNYSIAYENYLNGTPLMRPLLFEEPDNQSYQNLSSTYLWGNDFLVTPITDSAVVKTKVHFPKNNVWFDFYTNEKIHGGQVTSVQVSEETIPTYVRAGAFIPMTKVIQSTDDYDSNVIQLHYYYDASVKQSERLIYNDDGKSNLYKNGNFEILKFSSKNSSKKIKLQFSKSGNYKNQTKQIELVIHGIKNRNPKSVKISDNGIISYDQNVEENTLYINPFEWDTTKKKTITIKL